MRAVRALVAALLAALAVACTPDTGAAPTPTSHTTRGVVVRREGGMLIVLTDDYVTVLVNNPQAYDACRVQDRYPSCRNK